MAIRFKCPQCQKQLAVKDHLAGKKAACPVCKAALTIPKPVSAEDAEALAAAALGEVMAETAPAPEAAEDAPTIDFNCPYCDEGVHFPLSEAGKQTPCPECRRIIKVPLPQKTGPKDWRELIKKGPSAALINQPEQLEGAWGTEVKTRVSGTAMQEAGAVPEAAVEPVGVGGWLRRAFFAATALGVVALIYVGMKNARTERREKDAIKVGLTWVADAKGGAPGRPKSKLPPLQTAEVYRLIGELHLGKNEPGSALKAFNSARAIIEENRSIAEIDADMFLGDLTLSMLELGGSEAQVLAKERFGWSEDVQPELLKTLYAMRSDEGKVLAMRRLATALAAKGQPDIALLLAGNLASSAPAGSRLTTQQIALLLARGKESDVKLKAPEMTGKTRIDAVARQAFAEGQARKGNLEAATALATYRGGDRAPRDRLETSLAVALVLLSGDRTTESIADAAPFFAEALTAYGELTTGPKAAGVSPWLTLQLIRVGHLLGEEEKVKDVGKKLDGANKNRAALERLRGTLGRASQAQALTLPDQLEPELDLKADSTGTTRALAWSALARHNGRHGGGGEVRDKAESLPAEDGLRPFLILGVALGEQDRSR